MPRPRSLSPALVWHKRAKQWTVRIDGRLHYLGRDEAEAQRRRHELIAAWLAGAPAPEPKPPPAPSPPAGLLVVEALEVYQRWAEARHGAGQLARIDVALDAVGAVAGRLSVEEFGPKTLKAVREHLLSRPDRRGKTAQRPALSRDYVNSVIGCVQTAWQWLAVAGTHGGLDLLDAQSSLSSAGGHRPWALRYCSMAIWTSVPLRRRFFTIDASRAMLRLMGMRT